MFKTTYSALDNMANIIYDRVRKGGYAVNDLQAYLDDALKRVKLESEPDEPFIEDYDIHSELRELITTTRNFLDVTQIQLAEKSGISQSNISKIESGNYQPSVATLKKIADALGKRLVIDFADREDFE